MCYEHVLHLYFEDYYVFEHVLHLYFEDYYVFTQFITVFRIIKLLGRLESWLTGFYGDQDYLDSYNIRIIWFSELQESSRLLESSRLI